MKVLTVRGEFEKQHGGKKGEPQKIVADHQLDVEEVIAAADGVSEKDVKKRFQNNISDFRELPEPQRTLGRLDYIMKMKDLNPVFKIAAYTLIRSFYGNDSHFQFVKVKDLLPENEGYSSRARSGMLAALEEHGLIEKNLLVKKGLEIRLLF